ncbi:MAG: AbrB/MazE/SpoVT family DNA-binding domain-containing protein [Candidatus Nanoarchaeia archaeon]|nr:AbrB/MazE/SpoVT family DNA-binding domain-containing protein [Candidatus Nanoarchaeia archaeon]
MKRKIIQHGPSSLTISIPAQWVKKNNLKKGDEIEVIEKNKDLVIKSTQKTEHKTVEISFEKTSTKTQEEILLSLHKKGYSSIKIKNIDDKIIKHIYSFLNTNQLSLEITKQEKNFVNIENISNPDDEQLDNLEKRTFRILIEYSYKILQILSSKESITENCYLHESSIKRISNYCKRIIIKENNPTSIFNYLIIDNIEGVTRNFTEILKCIDKENSKILKNELFINTFNSIFELLQETYNLSNKFSIGRYSTLNEELIRIEKELNKLKENDKHITSIYLINVSDNLKMILNSILTMNI